MQFDYLYQEIRRARTESRNWAVISFVFALVSIWCAVLWRL